MIPSVYPITGEVPGVTRLALLSLLVQSRLSVANKTQALVCYALREVGEVFGMVKEATAVRLAIARAMGNEDYVTTWAEAETCTDREHWGCTSREYRLAWLDAWIASLKEGPQDA